ncbi:hypothetical protein B5807_05127 [Epicoccum nigrum]|jgi:ribonuclease P protein subunit RPR2|uniref:Rpr2-domain-containing protein n=1 Tax=Epicoccum nigrum TaxID=105696 RepID=A0A1Y2M1N5_EPING|nr:hypothetical protein B5807_05127 [Epicoccum nigrum]
MAKDKDKLPKAKGVPNKHLHARTSFLYQAATYLTLQSSVNVNVNVNVKEAESSGAVPLDSDSKAGRVHQPSPLALQLGSDLHTVSRKAQLRLSIDLKRSMCKSCHTILVPGQTAAQTIENESKGGSKPWADVLVVSCNVCGSKRRIPVGARRQRKKRDRIAATVTTTTSDMEGVQSTTPTVHSATEQSPSSR